MKKAFKLMPFLMVFGFVFALTSCGDDKPTDDKPAETQTDDGGETQHSHSYVAHEEKEATWNEEGNISYYTCSGCDKIFDSNKTEILANQIKIAPKKLSYEFKNVEWSDDNLRADAVYVNKTNSSDIVKLAASVTKTEKAATCDENGEVKYVATHDGNSVTKSLLLSKAPHEYEFRGLQWSNDNQSAVAFYVCDNNPNHTKTEAAVIKSTLLNASCETAGTKKIKATYDGGYEEISIRLDATGHDFEDIVVPATCTEGGYTTHICNNCDYEYTDSYTAALGHHYETEADCTHGAECDRCHEQVAALGHNYVLKDTHDADCTHAKSYDYECDRCHNKNNVEEGPAKGHNIEGVTGVAELVDPDCCEYAMMYKCKTCNEFVEGEHIHKHNYKASITTAATCTHGGVKTYTCENCDDSYGVDTNRDSEAHDWTLGTPSGGTRIDTCKNCNETRSVKVYEGTTTDEIPADDLANNKVEVNGANLALDEDLVNSLSGKSVQLSVEQANKSDLNLTDDQKTQIGENPIYDFGMTSNSQKVDFGGNSITITLPYTLETGEDVDNIAIWFIEDSGEVVSIKATYNNGFVTFTTNHFSYYTITRLTPAERCALYGHQYADPIHIDGGCTGDSYDLIVCKRCHHTEIENLEKAQGHKYVLDQNESYPATCTKEGLNVFVCEHCHDTFKDKILATGHNHEIDASKHVNATCTTTGKDVYVCKNCNDSYEVAIPMLGHIYVDSKVTATCEAFGYDLHECSVCHQSYKDNYTTPVTHTITWTWSDDFNEATLNIVCSAIDAHSKQATATIKVLEATATCEHDGETVYQAIAVIDDLTYTDTKTAKVDKLAHTPSDELSFDGDTHWHTCTMCHQRVDEEGHTWGDDHTCDICGATKCTHEPTIRKFFNMADYYDDCCGLFMDYYTCECGKVVTASQFTSYSPLVSLCHIGSKDSKEVLLPDGSMSQIVDCPDCGLHIESIYDPVVYSGTMIIYYNGENLLNIYVEGRRLVNIDLEDHECCGGTITYYETSDSHVPFSIESMNITCPGFVGGSQGTLQENGHMVYDYTCPDCGLHFVRDMYKEEHDCYDEMHVHVTITKGETTILDVDQTQNQETDEKKHAYEYEILNKDKEHANCKDRIAVIARCRVCGEYHLDQFSSHTVNGEYNYKYDQNISLAEYGVDANIKYAICSVCGDRIYSEYESFRELSNLVTGRTQRSEDGHQIEEYTIGNSNLKLVKNSYRVYSTQCEYVYHNVISILNGNDVIFTYDNYYNSSDHSYETEYQFTTSVHDCEKGVIVSKTCTKCGDHYSYTTTGHYTGETQDIDLNEEYGIPARINYSECPCGKDAYIYVYFENNSSLWRYTETTYTDSKGIEHKLQNYSLRNGNATIQIDKYEVATATLCKYDSYTKYLITKDNKIIFNKSSHSTMERHNEEYTYEWLSDGDDHDCQDGIRVTSVCSVCGKREQYTEYGHNSRLIEEIDLSKYSKCGGYIREYNCACGKQHHFETEFKCKFGHEACEKFVTDAWDTNFEVIPEIWTCGVQGCDFKVRYARYYKLSDSCKKELVEVYQIGYNPTNNTYIKEIRITEMQIRHDTETNTQQGTTSDGLEYYTQTSSCKHCDYTSSNTEYFDSHHNRVRSVNETTDPLNDNYHYLSESKYSYKYFAEVGRYMVVEEIYNYGKESTRITYQYDFSCCQVTKTYEGDKYHQEVYNFHEYMWLDDATCTQPAGRICRICGDSEKYTAPHGHNFIKDDNEEGYYCSYCGLESDTNAHTNVILEDLSNPYDDCFVIGYYEYDDSIDISPRIVLDVKDTDDDIVLDYNDITFNVSEEFYSAVEISKSELYSLIEQKYSDNEIVGMSFVFVEDITDGLEYHITLNMQ